MRYVWIMVGFTFLLTGSTVLSQSVLVSEDIMLRSDMRYEVMPMDTGRTLLFRDRVFEQDVLGFDETLRNIWTQEMTFEKRRIGMIGLVHGQNDFTILYQFRDRMSVYIVGRKYDAQARIIQSDTLSVINSLLNTPDFYLAESQDRSKAIIFSTENSDAVRAIGVDIDSLSVMWEHHQLIREVNVRKDFRSTLVTNDGRGYIILEADNTWGQRKSHRLEILPLDSSARQMYVPLPGVVCYDVRFNFNNRQNSIFGACSFSEKSDNKTVGIMTLTLNLEATQDYTLSTVRFSEELLQDIYGKKVKKKKGLRDLAIRHIQARQDGGLVVFGELSKEYSRRPSFATSASTYSRRWVDYYFEDIVVFSIHPDGKLHWSEVLHKRQYSQDDDAMYSSFFVFELPSQLRILFNDEIRSENTVSEYIVTGKGLQERKNLMSTDYQNLKLRFREAIQTNNNTLIVPSLKGNRLSLVKISYDET
ncbi:MAG: hypothetical protein R3275_07485 [Saprospiraceae bacterium]|nr:hypothetical protein [Saprospiraceae bacterium]